MVFNFLRRRKKKKGIDKDFLCNVCNGTGIVKGNRYLAGIAKKANKGDTKCLVCNGTGELYKPTEEDIRKSLEREERLRKEVSEREERERVKREKLHIGPEN